MKHFEDDLESYLEGWLSTAQRRELEGHLANCPRCREALEEQGKVKKLLSQAAPDVPSKRMWQAIQERLDRGEGEALPSFWEKWAPARYWASAGAGALALAALLWGPHLLMVPRPGQGPASQAPAVSQPPVQPKETQPSRPAVHDDVSAAPALGAKKAALEVAAAVPQPVAQPSRLAARRAAKAKVSEAEESAPAAAMEMRPADNSTPMVSAEAAGYGQGLQGGAASEPRAMARSEAPRAAEAKLPQAAGGSGGDGSWNWEALQAAFNQGNWPQVAAELKAARQGAGRSAERSFAVSAINLLSSPGQPLSGMNMAAEPDAWSSDLVQVMVLQARDWRLNAPAHQAVFRGSVMTRQRGLRSEGPGYSMDLEGGKGFYAPATEFTRLAGEKSVRVLNASQQEVETNHFAADQGATYDYGQKILYLGGSQ